MRCRDPQGCRSFAAVGSYRNRLAGAILAAEPQKGHPAPLDQRAARWALVRPDGDEQPVTASSLIWRATGCILVATAMVLPTALRAQMLIPQELWRVSAAGNYLAARGGYH